MKKRLAILGSTGSIGTQALEIVRAHPHLFVVEVLTANNNAELLIQQALTYSPSKVVIANPEKYHQLSNALQKSGIEVYAGTEYLQELVALDTVDMVVAAMVGYAGLLPVISAIKAKKHIALANKETLVVAGDLITKLCAENQVSLLPVDSEHSAIFQCLEGENPQAVEKIILTCSGGPFRKFSLNQLKNVGPAQALNHPNWDMGAKITIDSASLMNKGFEAIEAKWLFNLEPSQIDVIVHPQSIIHSLVQFTDGSIKAQLGLPDMRLPIQYAMCYPQRVKSSFKRFDFSDFAQFDFHAPDTKIFRNLAIAYEAMNMGGNVACAMNAANEIVVKAFLDNKIAFLRMPDIIERTIAKVTFVKNPSVDDYIASDTEARNIAHALCKQLT